MQLWAILDPEFWWVMFKELWWIFAIPCLVTFLLGGFIGYKVGGRNVHEAPTKYYWE